MLTGKTPAEIRTIFKLELVEEEISPEDEEISPEEERVRPE